MNDLPEVVSQSKYEETDYSIPKIVLLTLVATMAGVAAVYEFIQFLITFQYAFLWLGITALVLFLATNVANTLFVKSTGFAISMAFVESLAPLALFTKYAASDSILILLGSLAFMFFCIASAMHRGASVLRNSVKIKFFEIAHVVTPKLMTGVLAVACTLIYLTYVPWGGLTSVIGHKIVDGALIASQPGIQLVYPMLTVNETVEKALRDVTVYQIAHLPAGAIPNVPFDLSAGIAQLSASDREIVYSKLTDELKSGVEAKVGTFKKDETIKEATYRLLADYFNKLPALILMIGEVTLAFLLFLSLRSLAALTYWFIDFIAFVIFKFIIASDFALVTYEARSREFVILP